MICCVTDAMMGSRIILARRRALRCAVGTAWNLAEHEYLRTHGGGVGCRAQEPPRRRWRAMAQGTTREHAREWVRVRVRVLT